MSRRSGPPSSVRRSVALVRGMGRRGARRSRPARGDVPTPRGSRPLLVSAAVVAVLGLGAPHAGANLIGSADDRVGDATDPAPARDLSGAGIAYDRRRGALVGAVGLRAAPTDATAGDVGLFAGTRTPAGCVGYPAIGFFSSTSTLSARWAVLRGGPAPDVNFAARKRGSGATIQRFEAVDPRLKGHRPDCVIATLTAPGDPTTVWDAVGPFDLRAVPVLSTRLSGVPSRLSAGTARRVRLTLRNDGDAATPAGRVTVAGARGLRVSPRSSRVRPIPAGGRRTVSFRVSLTARAGRSTRLRVTASAGDQRVRAEGRILLRRPKATGGSGNGSGGGGARTCTRYAPDPFGDTGGSLVLVPC